VDAGEELQETLESEADRRTVSAQGLEPRQMSEDMTLPAPAPVPVNEVFDAESKNNKAVRFRLFYRLQRCTDLIIIYKGC